MSPVCVVFIQPTERQEIRICSLFIILLNEGCRLSRTSNTPSTSVLPHGGKSSARKTVLAIELGQQG